VSKQAFGHRRDWIVKRLEELADIYAVSIWAYAVMSNHVHSVIEIRASTAETWSAEDVAARWLRLYPPKEGAVERRVQNLAGNPARIQVLRGRLCSLSWFMKSLNEPIARQANREDGVTGHFWEARYRSQALLDDAGALAAMAYVDLNPIRAGIAESLGESLHTSIERRAAELASERSAASVSGDLAEPGLAVSSCGVGTDMRLAESSGAERAEQTDKATKPDAVPTPPSPSFSPDSHPLTPIFGLKGRLIAAISTHQYIELVDLAGREWHPGKRGRITGEPPKVLEQLGLDRQRWVSQVRAIKPSEGFWRAVGSEAALTQKAAAIGQHWLRGISTARALQS
jgi:REP element-mobilizing transposase RayT